MHRNNKPRRDTKSTRRTNSFVFFWFLFISNRTVSALLMRLCLWPVKTSLTKVNANRLREIKDKAETLQLIIKEQQCMFLILTLFKRLFRLTFRLCSSNLLFALFFWLHRHVRISSVVERQLKCNRIFINKGGYLRRFANYKPKIHVLHVQI